MQSKLFAECKCDEGRFGGFTPDRRYRWQFAHDCDYVAQRNALIPEAERIATRQMLMLPVPAGSDWDQEWSRAFLAAMDDLSRGLRAC